MAGERTTELRIRQVKNNRMRRSIRLLFLMPVFAQAFFTLVGCHLVSLSFFSAWHDRWFGSYLAFTDDFTLLTKVLAGLNAGILWAGIMMVVFLEMFLPVFSALLLMIKLPKPRK